MDFSIIRKKIDQNKVRISPARRQVTYCTSIHSWEFFPTSWNATFVLLFLCFFGASQDVLRKYGHDWLCFNLIWSIAVASEKNPRWHLFKSDTLFLIDRCQKCNSASTTLGSSLTTRRRWKHFHVHLINYGNKYLFSLTLCCNNRAANWFQQALSALVCCSTESCCPQRLFHLWIAWQINKRTGGWQRKNPKYNLRSTWIHVCLLLWALSVSGCEHWSDGSAQSSPEVQKHSSLFQRRQTSDQLRGVC